MKTYRTLEIVLLIALISAAMLLLFFFFEPPPASLSSDLLTKLAFAILVAVLSRILMLFFGWLDEDKFYNSFKKTGMIGIHQHLGDDGIKAKLEKSRVEVKILKTWFPESLKLTSGLKSAITNGARLKILLLQPDAAILEERSKSATNGRNPKEGSGKVIEALTNIHKWAKAGELKGFDIGLYNTWPACPVIWYDNNIIMGFYLHGHSSVEWPWIEVDPGSDIAKYLDEQFQSLWEHPATKHIDDIATLEAWLEIHPLPKEAQS